MSSSPGFIPTCDTVDFLPRVLDTVARFLFWVGILATVVGLGFLVYTVFVFAGSGANTNVPQALANVDICRKILLGGVLGLGIGSSYLFWGEETIGPIQLIAAAALFFAALYLPPMAG